MLVLTLSVLLLVPGECSVGHELLPASSRRLQEAGDDAGQGFLSSLPLELVSATPTVLLSPTFDDIPLEISSTIQVVYSRAVIPLGSNGTDFRPFFLEPSSAGRFRWVNSYIARCDPVGAEWAPDLRLHIRWNHDLVAWDGARQVGTDMLQVRG